MLILYHKNNEHNFDVEKLENAKSGICSIGDMDHDNLLQLYTKN